MHVDAQAFQAEELIGRRLANRHRLDLSARLVAPCLSLRVQLEDISATGTCVRFMQPCAFESGRLSWLGFAAFVTAVWRTELRCGMMFVDPLSDECLRRTIEFGALVGSGPADKYGRLASAWVHGPGDW